MKQYIIHTDEYRQTSVFRKILSFLNVILLVGCLVHSYYYITTTEINLLVAYSPKNQCSIAIPYIILLGIMRVWMQICDHKASNPISIKRKRILYSKLALWLVIAVYYSWKVCQNFTSYDYPDFQTGLTMLLTNQYVAESVLGFTRILALLPLLALVYGADFYLRWRERKKTAAERTIVYNLILIVKYALWLFFIAVILRDKIHNAFRLYRFYSISYISPLQFTFPLGFITIIESIYCEFFRKK